MHLRPRTLRRSGARSSCHCPQLKQPTPGTQPPPPHGTAVAAHTVGGATAAAEWAAAAARSVGGTAAAAAGVAAAADPVVAAVTAGARGNGDARYARRNREGVCGCNGCRGDRRRRRSRHDQRGDEFQFRHHDFGFTTKITKLKTANFQRNAVRQLNCGITSAASRSIWSRSSPTFSPTGLSRIIWAPASMTSRNPRTTSPGVPDTGTASMPGISP